MGRALESDGVRPENGPAESSRGSAPRTVAVHTHGCKLNQSDSQTLVRQFQEAGFRVVASPRDADVVVLNSCTVTATADAKARQFLRATRRNNPGALVVATGCYAQRAPAELRNMDGVSLVLDNRQKGGLVDSVAAVLDAEQPPVTEAPSNSPRTSLRSPQRTRAMVKIQEGCDQVCAYCIVPKVRGRERSIPPEDIIAAINRHADDGYREVVLTGTQLGTYGFDIPGASLQSLLSRVLAETSIDRIRVSSLQAQEITGGLLELWGDPRLCPHFHIPLQSGSDRILKAMRRRYDTGRFAETVALVRAALPAAGVTTDLIVGFPGEGEAEFAASYGFAKSMEFSDMHVFPYSPRPGTSAAYFSGEVDEGEKRTRMGRMLDLSFTGNQRFRLGQLGEVRSVLWERTGKRAAGRGGAWSGLTDNYLRVRAESEANLANRITPARLTGLEGDVLLATPELDANAARKR